MAVLKLMEIFILFFLTPVVRCLESSKFERNVASNETSFKYYSVGISMGIINPEKYPFESFLRDEWNVFNNLYKEFASHNDTQLINYHEWLILNNYGLFPDTQESIYDKKISKRSVADNKRRFINTVRKGDIIISTGGPGIAGLTGHASIMSSDYYVLEMPGGPGYKKGIPDNNRQIGKDKWFDDHQHDWNTVYRCPDDNAARSAATWADHTYYNPSGGSKKTKHITYKITPDVWSTNPSYCSKLVIHAYYYGTGKKKVISPTILRINRIIPPMGIPNYFTFAYRLQNKGKF